MGSGFKIVLASTSPRRRELLLQLGVKFEVVEPLSEESSTESDPRRRVVENAEAKARSVAGLYQDSLIIGTDTVVFIEGVFLGKPSSSSDAVAMLERLSAKIHSVFTGIAILNTNDGTIKSSVDETEVKFKKLDNETIRKYVDSGEPMDKAGAYAIQGGAGSFVEWIDGSRSNVIGLSLELLTGLLSNIM